MKTEATSGPGTGQPSVTLTYSYDPSHDLISISDSLSGSGATGQGITTYVYDNALRLGTITQSAGGTVKAELLDTYDPGGRLIEQTRPLVPKTYITTSYTYDAANDLLSVQNSFGFGDSFQLQGESQTANTAGQVLSETYNDGTSTNSYTYLCSGQPGSHFFFKEQPCWVAPRGKHGRRTAA